MYQSDKNLNGKNVNPAATSDKICKVYTRSPKNATKEQLLVIIRLVKIYNCRIATGLWSLSIRCAGQQNGILLETTTDPVSKVSLWLALSGVAPDGDLPLFESLFPCLLVPCVQLALFPPELQPMRILASFTPKGPCPCLSILLRVFLYWCTR